MENVKLVGLTAAVHGASVNEETHVKSDKKTTVGELLSAQKNQADKIASCALPPVKDGIHMQQKGVELHKSENKQPENKDVVKLAIAGAAASAIVYFVTHDIKDMFVPIIAAQ